MILISSIHTSNQYGKFKIVNYINNRNVVVEFLSTGYQTTTEVVQIKKGQVKDKLHPFVQGVGYVGCGKYKATISKKSYSIWHHMIVRCYDEKYQKSQPTYIGCTVCDDWHNFQNFAKWFDENYIEGFHLDKDIKQKGVKNKVYSPVNCLFVSQKDNNIESHAKIHIFTNPKGEVVEFYNLSDFCEKNNLDAKIMSNVRLGKVKQHKGWRSTKAS